MFTTFGRLEPWICDMIANDSASLLRSAGRRIFYHLQRLEISVDFKELVRSAPKAEELVKTDGGTATEEIIKQGVALLFERYRRQDEVKPSSEPSLESSGTVTGEEGDGTSEDASTPGETPRDDATSPAHDVEGTPGQCPPIGA
jgi:hypothetical protein